MPVLLIVGALVVGYFIWRMNSSGAKGQIGTPRNPRVGKCNWVATGNDTVALGEYFCKTCKVTAYAQGGNPPKECKKNLRGSL